MFKSLLSILFLTMSLCVAHAEDAEGGKDHPLFPRMSKFQIHNYQQKNFNGFDFFLDKEEEKTQRVEGKFTEVEYNEPGDVPTHSILEVLRNHINAIKQIGGVVVMQNDNKATLKLVKNGREIWTHVDVSNDGASYSLTIVEKAAMKQEISSNDMLDALNQAGHIALYINFDTAKSTIKKESMPVVNEVVKLLKDNPSLSLRIEGHTDNVGDAKKNLTLSNERAQSVVAALVREKISANRLEAKGFGMTKPVADNSTEDGKAKNRRVELVKR